MDGDALPCANCISSVLACLILATTFVGSLYVWKSPHSRNHPSVIKQRFLSGFFMTFISPVFLWLFLPKEILQKNSIPELLGFRLPGLIQALVIPLLLTVILFLGQVADAAFRGFKNIFSECRDFSEPQIWIWLRNYIVAPLSEEVIFRACMLPLLLTCFKPMAAVFICPLFFGTAHFNRLAERVLAGVDFKHAFLFSFFQFIYTTIFGAYSAYLFVRTGHFVPSFLAHVFCNIMGLADIMEIVSLPEPRRSITAAIFVIGFISWCYLLSPLTSPALYSNNLFWADSLS
ncbi:CAAX prenyl protease 2 isoform X2 [Bemisia tabaci]|uniref:CAAX prenyl protease 2 isoform X2 n=1 Tax=Bemisia tabaci TaxID=7038 RepID=UPI0008F99B72|nr:PREDICTED: CAAX prenyl protease 2 isoform X2 [Bemisia tabaci]